MNKTYFKEEMVGTPRSLGDGVHVPMCRGYGVVLFVF